MTIPTILTERLRLRPWTLDDIDTLQRIFDNEDVRRYLFDGLEVSHERAEEVLLEHLPGSWCIVFEETTIGFVGISGEDPELIYGLLPQYWGRGFATEAALAVVDYARSTGAASIHARTDPPNDRSVRVMERLGMQPAGVESGPAGQPLITYRLVFAAPARHARNKASLPGV